MLKPNVLMKDEFSQFEEIFKERFLKRKFLNRGDVAYGEFEHNNKNNYYVLDGMLDSSFVHEDGGIIHLVFRGPGTIFPLYYSYESTSMDRILVANAIAHTELIVIPKTDLHDLMMELPKVAIAMIDAYGKFSTYLDYALASRLYDSVSTKVCSFLLLHSSESNQVKYTHEEIAKAVGSSRAKVSEVISELKKEGIVDTGRGSLRINDCIGLAGRCSYIAGLGD